MVRVYTPLRLGAACGRNREWRRQRRNAGAEAAGEPGRYGRNEEGEEHDDERGTEGAEEGEKRGDGGQNQEASHIDMKARMASRHLGDSEYVQSTTRAV